MKDIENTLKSLQVEDIVWVIYLFIASFALLSNQLERDYLFTNNPKSKRAFKTINITILIVSFFIYLYFLSLTYQNLRKVNPETSFKDAIIANAAVVVVSLFIIGVVISLTIEITTDTDNE